jgi:hypothetical protein
VSCAVPPPPPEHAELVPALPPGKKDPGLQKIMAVLLLLLPPPSMPRPLPLLAGRFGIGQDQPGLANRF